jgi:hypothetical protein
MTLLLLLLVCCVLHPNLTHSTVGLKRIYGEVSTSRYFHRKAVLSTLDQLGKTKRHTQGNLQKTRHTRPSSQKNVFCFFVFFWFLSKHTDMATAAHIGYSIMHSRLEQSVVSTPRAHDSNLQAGLNTIVHACITASTTPFEPTRKAEPTCGNHKCPYRNPQHAY